MNSFTYYRQSLSLSQYKDKLFSESGHANPWIYFPLVIVAGLIIAIIAVVLFCVLLGDKLA